MDEDEIRKSASLEDRHWWYSSRRKMLRRLVAPVTPGRALDVGCGSGGNTAVLRDLGWQVTGLEYSPAAAELAHARGLDIVQGDATRLPFPDGSFDLVISTDMWEHIEDHEAVARETARVVRPGGRVLVAVPCSMKLWSGHDLALGHVRRYEKDTLRAVIEGAGLEVVDLHSWNVLLRPVALMRRRRSSESESEMEETSAPINAGLKLALAIEAQLPVHRLPGISLVALARKP
jgi:SAM-dependent methyltransferase